MQIYLLIYAFFAGTAFFVRSHRQSWHLALLSALFLALFIGGRDEVGCDFLTYQARFEYLYPPYVGWLDVLTQSEGGFHLVNIFSRDFDWGFHGVLMMCGIIYAGCLLRFAKLAPRPMGLIAIAFPILVLQLGMSGMRQAVATAFLMLAYVAFTQRRRWATAIWIAVAYLFHESAIAFLPMAMLARRQVSAKYLIVGVVLLSPVAGWLLGDRFEVYHDRYVDQIYGENSSNGAWIRYVAAVLPFVVFLWKRRLVEQTYPTLYPLLWLFMLISFALALAGGVSTVALHRLTFYVLPVSLLAFWCVIESAFSPRSRQIAATLPFAMYGIYILGWFLMSRHGTSCYIPYQSWLL